MDFIRREWRSTHILGNNKPFFLYEFRSDKDINFIIARELSSGSITGLVGFIKSNSSDTPDIWTSLWKVKKGTKDPVLGIRILNFLRNNIRHRKLIVAGSNDIASALLKRMKFQTGCYSQYYMINPHVEDYRILVSKDHSRKDTDKTLKPENRLTLVRDFDDLGRFDSGLFINSIPYKDSSYIKRRYFDYPDFDYLVYGIKTDGDYSSIIILREVTVGDAKILRIVDFIGNEEDLLLVKDDLRQILIDNKYEYIDFLEYGMSDDILAALGFCKLNVESDDLIVPNYFSPLVQENTTIHFAADIPVNEKFFLFKADGDQDRPNPQIIAKRGADA